MVSKYQYDVFKKFNIELNQFQGNLKHSEFMNNIINNYDCDFYIFFDIDCIPLKEGIIEYIVEKIGQNSMIGIEQQSNSPLKNTNFYELSILLHEKKLCIQYKHSIG